MDSRFTTNLKMVAQPQDTTGLTHGNKEGAVSPEDWQNPGATWRVLSAMADLVHASRLTWQTSSPRDQGGGGAGWKGQCDDSGANWNPDSWQQAGPTTGIRQSGDVAAALLGANTDPMPDVRCDLRRCGADDGKARGPSLDCYNASRLHAGEEGSVHHWYSGVEQCAGHGNLGQPLVQPCESQGGPYLRKDSPEWIPSEHGVRAGSQCLNQMAQDQAKVRTSVQQKLQHVHWQRTVVGSKGKGPTTVT